jgi:sulfur-oxidizing protein SoxY
MMERRKFLAITGAATLAATIVTHPVLATPSDVKRAMRDLFGDAPMTKGRVKLDIPNLVENGNTVSVTLSADGPMAGPQRINSLHLYAEENPAPNVGSFYFGPRAGQIRVSARIRLATTQTVWLVGKAEDGSLWSDGVEVLVTLAACIE